MHMSRTSSFDESLLVELVESAVETWVTLFSGSRICRVEVFESLRKEEKRPSVQIIYHCELIRLRKDLGHLTVR
jgi:hypothetical protein